MISVAPGANAKLSPSKIDAARETIEQSKVLLLQLEIPLDAVERACDIAHSASRRVLLNPAPAQPLPPELLNKVSVLIANEEEMAALGSEVDVERTIVTLGARGGRVMERGGESWSFEAQRVKAKDTVGAGDCFCGWLAAGLAAGWSFKTCIETAAKAATLSVTRRGAQPSLPYRDEVLA
jgi:ribokinase